MALKLLRKANLNKHECMIALTGENFANKESMYEEAKHIFDAIWGFNVGVML